MLEYFGEIKKIYNMKSPCDIEKYATDMFKKVRLQSDSFYLHNTSNISSLLFDSFITLSTLESNTFLDTFINISI